MRFLLVLFALNCAPMFAVAHEFWIAPVDYVINADQPIKAQLRIGQKFEGAVQRYYKKQIARFEVYKDGKPVEVAGRLGDNPALNMDALGEGLLVVVHETTDSVLTYRKPELFVNFATHKGVAELIASHKARGLPSVDFREVYRRFGKSLIASGHGDGNDLYVGMRAEIVALANPYLDDLSKGLPVQVFYNKEPRENAFIELFARHPDGNVTVSGHRSDENGIAILPVLSGVEYLVDATLILPLPNEDITVGPVWESLWASLTFLVPPE